MLVALLVVALVCLAVGLVLPSVAWLIASLIATAGAGYLLVKARSTILAPGPAGAGTISRDAAGPEIAGTDSASTDVATSDAGRTGEAHGQDATTVLPRLDENGATAGTSASVEAEAPGTAGAAGNGSGGADGPVAGPDDVWVIDGRPRYHLRQCVIIQGQDAEPIPFDQAVEDGFMPCSLCEPQLERAAARDA